jgi:hypothetical protein
MSKDAIAELFCRSTPVGQHGMPLGELLYLPDIYRLLNAIGLRNCFDGMVAKNGDVLLNSPFRGGSGDEYT